MDSLWTPRNITPIEGSCYEVTNASISQEIFSHLTMLSMKCRKNIRVSDNQKRMSKAGCINIYTYAICDANDSK